ncbi:MAG: protein kinase [Gammaproteobacteria bacterium]|nr:protein kinase [Gammaproteobacteria bacterium]
MPIRKLKPFQYNPVRSSKDKDIQSFLELIAPDIEALNQAIDLYNRETDSAKKLSQLQAIYSDFQRLNNGCSDEVVSGCSDYDEQVNQQLFEDMQREFEGLGVTSMQQALLPHPLEVAVNPASPDEVIANMPPDKMKNLVTLLFLGKRLDLNRLKTEVYRLSEPGSAAFFQFLRTHDIRSMAGTNSKNFEIVEKDSEPEKRYVLQLENRLGMSMNAESYLRKNGLFDVFVPTLASRQVFYFNEDIEHMFTRNVLIAPFCDGNDLNTRLKKVTTNEERQKAAIDMYTQMAEVFAVTEANGCVFTDAKNSNWLVDEDGNLKISDTKGFLFTNAQGQLDLADAEKKNGNYGVFIASRHTIMPEGWENKPAANKAHAYMLGINLYQYLTKCDEKYFMDERIDCYLQVKPVERFDFSDEIFRGLPGEELKALVQGLLQTDPTSRPTVTEARETLKRMNPVREAGHAVRKTAVAFECAPLIKEIEKFRVTARGVQDVTMDTFLADMRSRMSNLKTQEEMKVLKAELNSTLDALQDSEKMVKDIETSMNKWGWNRAEKGRKIGEALARVPLTERGHIAEGSTPETQAVLKAMAYHRHEWRSATEKKGREGDITKGEGAQTFKDFKAKYQSVRPKQERPEQEQDKKNENDSGASHTGGGR